MSQGRRLGTMCRCASLRVSLTRAQGTGCQVLMSSSPRRSRSFKRRELCAVTAAHHPARLLVLARTMSCASASTSQGSTEPHPRNTSSLHALVGVRVHLTAMFACHLACRACRSSTSATCGASWWLRRPGTTPSWQRWRRSSGNRLGPQSLPRLRTLVARERRPRPRVPSATPTSLH